jgi:hypothetical protein
MITKRIFRTTEDNIDEVRDELYSYEYQFDRAVVKNPDGEKIETTSFDYLMDLMTFYYNQIITIYLTEY